MGKKHGGSEHHCSAKPKDSNNRPSAVGLYPFIPIRLSNTNLISNGIFCVICLTLRKCKRWIQCRSRKKKWKRPLGNSCTLQVTQRGNSARLLHAALIAISCSSLYLLKEVRSVSPLLDTAQVASVEVVLINTSIPYLPVLSRPACH